MGDAAQLSVILNLFDNGKVGLLFQLTMLAAITRHELYKVRFSRIFLWEFLKDLAFLRIARLLFMCYLISIGVFQFDYRVY